MGKLLKVLSGADVVKILGNFGFAVVGQRGSHIKLRRVKNFQKETLIVVNHTPIGKKTLRAVFTQASKYISQDELLPYFYD